MILQQVPDEVLLNSLRFRARKNPLEFFRPASAEQETALRGGAKGLLVLGGNRSGKSQIGAVRAVAKGLGRTVAGVPFRKARRIWCVSQTLPGHGAKDGEPEKPHTQLEAIQRWMPAEALRGGSWSRAYSPGSLVLTLADGTKYEFKSYDQALLAFESAAVDHIWFDEEPTRKSIFTSCLLRLVDRRGTWDMTLTPVLSLEGKSGIAEELWEGRLAGERGESAHGRYDTVQLYTSHNRHLPADEVQALERLPAEEKAVRLYGAFARLGGRVLNEFDPARHEIPDRIPPREWRHTLIIDPGWNTAGHLFAAADPKGRLYLYAEHYARAEPIPTRMAVLHAMWLAFGQPDLEVIVDAAAFYKTRQGGTEKEQPSDVSEYQAAADEIGAAWFQPVASIKADPQAYRVNRYLAADMLFVCKGLYWWRWEQERWTRQKEREGALAAERPVPEQPIKRFDHLMDCTRYLVNTLPDPIPDEAPPPTALEAHWSRFRESGKPAAETWE